MTWISSHRRTAGLASMPVSEQDRFWRQAYQSVPHLEALATGTHRHAVVRRWRRRQRDAIVRCHLNLPAPPRIHTIVGVAGSDDPLRGRAPPVRRVHPARRRLCCLCFNRCNDDRGPHGRWGALVVASALVLLAPSFASAKPGILVTNNKQVIQGDIDETSQPNKVVITHQGRHSDRRRSPQRREAHLLQHAARGVRRAAGGAQAG